MSDKPLALVKIDDLTNNLRSTMARAGDVFAPSMRKQLSRIVAEYLKLRLSGAPFIHPGMAKMAKWAGCHERQARTNFSRLKQWGVVEIVAFPKGGRRASRFVVNLLAVKMLLVEMGANPSKEFCDKLSDARDMALVGDENPAQNPAVTTSKNPAVCPGSTAAGIHRTKRKASSRAQTAADPRVTHPQFSERGGRDV